MYKLLAALFTITFITTNAQVLNITTSNSTTITVTLLDSASKCGLLAKFNGTKDNTLRKQFTARTFLLNDGRVIVEFYDRQAVLIKNTVDLKKLADVRFVKNNIDFLKKNISYKIPLSYAAGKMIIANKKPERLPQFKSSVPKYFYFEVYRLYTKQILFIDGSKNNRSACIYADLKALACDNHDVLEQLYGSKDDEYLMKKLASGDRLADYEMDDYLVYPKYLPVLIKNHKLKLVEKKVYVSSFFGNLYESASGYYMLIDEANQKNGAGDKMPILSLRIYDDLQQVRNAQKIYGQFKDYPVTSEHFYTKISDKYGQNFPVAVPELINSLPALLNIESDQLTLDSRGMDIVDEALHWIGTDATKFNDWFPAVLAYYGECFIHEKHDGLWVAQHDDEYNVWIPVVKLQNGTHAWDWREFYKSLFEGPIPIRWAGDWDERLKR